MIGRLSKRSVKVAAVQSRRVHFRMAVRASIRTLGSNVAREVGRVVESNFTFARSPNVGPPSPRLRPKFESLEDRVLLATNIGYVRQDTSDFNQLLGFYLDTETLNGVRNASPEISFNFGLSAGSSGNGGGNDQVFAGDWGNLGFDLVGVARDNTGLGAKQFFLDTDRDADAEYAFQFGFPSDIVIAGNFDGSSSDDVGVVRSVPGGWQWYLAYASADPATPFPTNGVVTHSASFSFGSPGDVPIAGDFNGDGRSDIGVVRNEVGGFKRWYIVYAQAGANPFPNNISTVPTPSVTYDFGLHADKPVVGDWDNNGNDNLGVVRNDANNALWLLDTSFGGSQELGMTYGLFTDQFITGQWPDRVWDGGAATLNWSDANNWSSNVLPDLSSTIVIDQPGTPTILHNSGVQNIGSIFSNEAISVTGGTLIVNHASDMAAVGINGGELVPHAPLGASAFSMSSGGLYLEASDPLGGLGLQLSGGSVVAAGHRSLTNDMNISNTVSFGGAGSLALHGTILGSGNFQKTGANFVQVLGANTYTGSTIINGGELLLGGSNRLPDTPISIAVGASLNLAGNNETVGALSGAGSVLLGSGAATFRTTTSASTNFSGSITGTGVFNKAGSGSLTLSGANNYTGDTHIEGGQLILGASNVLPNASFVDVQAATTLNLNGFSDTVLGLGGSGSVLMGSGSLTVGSSADSSFFGVLSQSGTVIKQGSGLWNLHNANTFTGGLNITSGTVRIHGPTTLADTLPVAISSGTTLSLNNQNETIGLVSGLGTVNLGSGTLTTTVSGNATLTPELTGTGGLTKAGSGTLLITSAKAYTGATTVASGTLIVNTNLNNSSGVSVANGAVLKGSGTVGATTVNGTLAPGNSPGILTTGNLSLASGSFLDMEIGGVTPGNVADSHDQVVVTGTVNIAGTADLNIVSYEAFVPYSTNPIVLVRNDGTDAIVGTFTGKPEGFVFSNFLGSGQNRKLTYVGGDGNDIALVVDAPVPPARIGDLDRSFGLGGIAAISIGNSNLEQVFDVAIQSDGKIVAAGYSNGDFAIIRLLSDGTLDPSFGGGDGIVTTDFGNFDVAYTLAMDSLGNIFVGGKSETVPGVTGTFALAKYNSSGALETTFGTAGKVTTDIYGEDIIRDLEIVDGKIIALGYS